MSFLEESWEEREEIHYRRLFGSTGKGIYPLSFELFEKQFGSKNIDPTWLTYGVFECPPDEKRKTWVYVTSGMSNPWVAEEKMDFSGFGVEFLMESFEESSWGIAALQSLMAFNILLSAGHYGEREMLDYGHRVPLKIQPNIINVVFSAPKDHPISFDLKSGKVELLQVLGITAEELAYAKAHGSNSLVEIIYNKQASLVTNPLRQSWVNA